MNFLFTMIITPIIQILEFFFTFFYEITNNQGIAVIGLSFVVTLCTLPLYMVAEKWEETERNIQKAMKPTLDNIKAVFRGDEQYMIISTYYRQNHYHPLMTLRSSFSLLIQIPFFISAYTFLSHLETLKGVHFLFIDDFGNPDATFHIGNFAVNILPILMTLINITSGIIYSKGHGIREKIQIFGCASVFLILLYNSPAGLVVYWTMNNILSLVKNVFYKLKNPLKVLYATACLISILFITSLFTTLKNIETEYKLIIFFISILIPSVPIIAKTWYKILDFTFYTDKKVSFSSFIIPAFTLLLLTGLYIPSTLMESEPEQYCYVEKLTSPFEFLRYTFFQAIGFCILWPTCFFSLFSNKVKKSMVLIYSSAAVLALVNCFCFSEDYGPILPELIFMTPQKFESTKLSLLLNITAMIAGIVFTCLLIKYINKLTKPLLSIVVSALLIISVKNIHSINREFKKMTPPVPKTEIEKSYHLSKTGKNVIVIMQDRFFLPHADLILNTHPDIKEFMDGFTFYRNTVSLGPLTMIGTPGLFGGYDYSPWEIMKRKDETLQKKHNEALLTMPRLFHEAGYSVTVSGLPYENYLEYPVTDMYKDDDYVIRAETRGIYSDYWYNENGVKKAEYLEHDIKRNFIWFSLFKIVPPALRRFIYHEKYWTSFDYYNDGLSRFIDNYSEMEYLSQMFDTNSNADSFIIIDNETVHESIPLSLDTHKPIDYNGQYGGMDKDNYSHYSTMVAVFNQYEKFISFLKENNVYDNTRIVIVSDHGTTKSTSNTLINNIPNLNKNTVVASLFVKDFNASGPISIDNSFMCNADTPWLATEGIIPEEKQVNPFTNKPLKKENKNDWIKIDVARAQSTRNRFKSGWDVPDDKWFTVHDDIYVTENWSPLFNK
ncbi:YidC/Oxa1 family membrane protein insertase [Treponema sp.]|uniref:YidC/Oxa1 family membrane protein insertase n=1 Tax=Treponema sp. TaxID=166 RepID=UPI00388DB0DC